MPTASDTIHLLILHGARANQPDVREAVQTLRNKGHDIAVRVTWEAGDAHRFAREAASSGEVGTVVAGGGDGTLHEVASGLWSVDAVDRPVLGVLPLGTGNDFACAAGISDDDPLPALELALTASAYPVDLGTVAGEDGSPEVFVNLATGGFGAQVTAETSEDLKKVLGSAAYFVTGLGRFAGLEPYAGRFSGPDFSWEGPFLFFGVGNGRRAGGGHTVCPGAVIDDGLLDLAILPAPVDQDDRARVGPVLGDFLSGGQDAVRERLVTARLSRVEVEAAERIHLNVDGEPLSGRRFRFGVEAEGLRLRLPPDCPLLGG